MKGGELALRGPGRFPGAGVCVTWGDMAPPLEACVLTRTPAPDSRGSGSALALSASAPRTLPAALRFPKNFLQGIRDTPRNV